VSHTTRISIPVGAVSPGKLMELPRGGYYVRTSAGPIQFGVPPETIKDCMSMSLDVPVMYVLPQELFDRLRGLSIAEFEFPAYYNFFLLKRKCRLGIEARGVERRVRAIFQETLFGPRGEPHRSEFADGFPDDCRPSFARESEFFRSQPGKGRLEVDDLVEFACFEEGKVKVGETVTVELSGDVYVVEDGGVVIARVPRNIHLPPRESAPDSRGAPWRPPEFGVTVLGASHGFDPKGKTTGFLLWMGGRAILVDPPTDATNYLAERGVAPKMIDGVILTHCHADHDAGTFQKILEEGQVSLYTTPFILGSFLRKYAALSGLDEGFLRSLFAFHPARIGAPLDVRGGELWFRYTLHSIPAIGVEAFYGGRSIAISGDTLYEPKRIKEMYDAGVIKKGRYEDLCTFRGHHSAYLHEAGIPPLHTPASALAELPEDVKSRLHLVHIADKDVPQGVGLRHAKVGLEHTLVIDTPQTPEFADAISLLEAVSMVDFLAKLPLTRARSLLQMAQRFSLPAGEKIVSQGTRGDSFYILINGLVSIVRDGTVLKTYRAGDYFGETALILNQPRSADAIAKTDVDLISIDRNDFLALLRGTDIAERLSRLAKVRDEGILGVFDRNSLLSRFSSGQKNHLQSYIQMEHAEANQLLWNEGDVPRRAYLVGTDAEIMLEEEQRPPRKLTEGHWLADIDAVAAEKPSPSRARVTKAGTLFFVERADLLRFFDENPGVYVAFLGTRFVE
jgi:glyoxylase-like metal-dependent hydrolase (beta-lactamase superfamily II)